VRILASSGKCQPYHSCHDVGLHIFVMKSRTIGMPYLDSHSVNVDLLVQIVEQCNGLDNHGVYLVRREFELEPAKNAHEHR
jgi:hypothetical protein